MIHLTGIKPGTRGGGSSSAVFRLEPLQRVLWSCEVHGSGFFNVSLVAGEKIVCWQEYLLQEF